MRSFFTSHTPLFLALLLVLLISRTFVDAASVCVPPHALTKIPSIQSDETALCPPLTPQEKSLLYCPPVEGISVFLAMIVVALFLHQRKFKWSLVALAVVFWIIPAGAHFAAVLWRNHMGFFIFHQDPNAYFSKPKSTENTLAMASQVSIMVTSDVLAVHRVRKLCTMKRGTTSRKSKIAHILKSLLVGICCFGTIVSGAVWIYLDVTSTPVVACVNGSRQTFYSDQKLNQVNLAFIWLHIATTFWSCAFIAWQLRITDATRYWWIVNQSTAGYLLINILWGALYAAHQPVHVIFSTLTVPVAVATMAGVSYSLNSAEVTST